MDALEAQKIDQKLEFDNQIYNLEKKNNSENVMNYQVKEFNIVKSRGTENKTLRVNN